MADKFRRKKEPRHLRLYHSITGTDAWRHLSGNGIKVLIALARLDDGNSNGTLFFSERKGSLETGLSRNTVRKALKELQEKGFIAQTKPGAFNRNNLLAATYRLTWVAWPGGKPAAPTRDFEKWKHENSQAQNLTPSGANIEPPLETGPSGGAENDPPLLETPLVHVGASGSISVPQVVYQEGRASAAETEQRKQANSCTAAILDDLRTWTLDHLKRNEVGEQSRLADGLGIPAGTLSKFLNGGNLPAKYREPLSDAVLVF